MSRVQALLERIADGFDRVVPLRRLRPLERIPSIKLKLSILIIAGIAITVATTTVGFWLDVRPRWSLLIAVGVALVLVQILARGITAPLREMSTAADAMAVVEQQMLASVLGDAASGLVERAKGSR